MWSCMEKEIWGSIWRSVRGAEKDCEGLPSQSFNSIFNKKDNGEGDAHGAPLSWDVGASKQGNREQIMACLLKFMRVWCNGSHNALKMHRQYVVPVRIRLPAPLEPLILGVSIAHYGSLGETVSAK